MKHYIFTITILCCTLFSYSQTIKEYEIKGLVLDSTSAPIENVIIFEPQTQRSSSTDKNGEFQMLIKTSLPAVELSFKKISYKMRYKEIVFEKNQKQYEVVLQLISDPKRIENVKVEQSKLDKLTNISVDANFVDLALSSTGSSVETVVKTLPGVSSRNELSNLYQVRGGNFDENHNFVNGIELRTHQLISSGEKEGLSSINPNFVKSIEFNGGGFSAEYGDRMSSILDVKYVTPQSFKANLNLSLLNNSLYIQDNLSTTNLNYAVGIRHKNTNYINKSLDTDASYNSNQYDIQAIANYLLRANMTLGFYFNFGNNDFKFIPHTRQTDFGTISNQYKLKMFFEGSENDKFQNTLLSVNYKWRISGNELLKSNLSYYNVYDEENLDITSQFVLTTNDVSENSIVEDVSTSLSHSRNKLNSNLLSFTTRYLNQINSDKSIKLGLDYKLENFKSRIDEWTMVDSTGSEVTYKFIDQSYNISDFTTNSIAAFAHYKANYLFETGSKLTYSFGLRANYWEFNSEWLLMPRFNLLYKPFYMPNSKFRISAGLYNQSDFSKQARNLKGEYNRDIRSPNSYNFILSYETIIDLYGTKYVINSGVYYKWLHDLIRYSVDNLKIDYTAENNGKGYSTGLDFMITGEFSEGAKSWLSASLMQSKVKFEGMNSFQPSLTDQRFKVNFLYQDYLVQFPEYKVKLNLNYSTGVPVDVFNSNNRTVRMPYYFRADMGFFRNFKTGFSFIEDFAIHFDVLNLFDSRNVASYLWVSDYKSNYYAVPNYLTSRRFNLSLILKFK